MKRAFLIFSTTLLSFNFGMLILNLQDFGLNWDIPFIVKTHYETSIYALKCGVIGVVLDYFTKDRFIKKDKKIKDSEKK
ncbi:hypothetical protein [Caviibacterium pharyngocola]|uniref:Uncharacterized protein n=1 Tax=Caviibacterium pharyngocola TaxID=28159 RepID=A0A2M8RSK3_9PAST|nr:hypothetical protein [Caviibacterium pharyngocola]PJG81872.1 hypothetical protein CVP04_12145 [Caviibacterium pharyngocola]